MNIGRGSRNPAFTREAGLRALGLDVTYERAEGSRLWYAHSGTHAVWDFLGGYGSTFFGHNHPALTRAAVAFLESRGVVHGQASTRAASDRLERELARRLWNSLATNFAIVLSNTGSEAVEIAAKHAEQALSAKRDDMVRQLGGDTREREPVRWSHRATDVLLAHGMEGGPGVTRRIAEYNRRVLARPPVHLAVEHGYHGMTAKALALTHDPTGRFGHVERAPFTRFVDARDPAALGRELTALEAPLLRVRCGEIETVPWNCAASVFVEPIQGEGGIRPLAPATALAWRAACDRHGVPLVADEIQSGLGRTGTFLYCEQLGLRPDYVLLGKSLGGGLAKLSAVAIASEQFIPGFTLQHSSTFAGDDFSSHVALRALDVLDEEGALAAAKEKGERLLAALRALATRHPEVVKDVRGCGLMLGLEWHSRELDRSNALRLLQEYGWLGYALSGFLLRAHGVRVAPTMAGGNTLRIEPAYAVPDAALDDLLAALDELCGLLERQDAARILAPCMGFALRQEQTVPVPRLVCRAPNGGAHVGFVGHFIDATDVALWDANFSRLAPDACAAFLDRLQPFVEPVVVHRDHVVSNSGATTTLTFVGLAVPSARFHRALRTDERLALRDLVQRAVDLAAHQGCTVVGLGGYSSIITRNGKDIRPNGVALTTGNGYAVAAGLGAMRATARELGIEWHAARAAVVGATGNIGAVLAELLAGEVASLALVARPARFADLEALAGRIMVSLAAHAPAAPMARLLHALPAVLRDGHRDSATLFRTVARELGSECPIAIGSDPGLCRGARLIAAATNEADSVLFPEHLSDGPVVINDLSVPSDVHASVAAARPQARVIRGGVIRTPANRDWRIPGVPLEAGEMYACMAETVLMGLEGHTSHGSYGALTPERVRATMEMASRHGFSSVRTTLVSRY